MGTNKRVTVNARGLRPTGRNSNDYFHFSPERSGVGSVPPLNTQCLQNSPENGDQSVEVPSAYPAVCGIQREIVRIPYLYYLLKFLFLFFKIVNSISSYTNVNKTKAPTRLWYSVNGCFVSPLMCRRDETNNPL